MGGACQHLRSADSSAESEAILSQSLVQIATGEGLIPTSDNSAVANLPAPHDKEGENAQLQEATD
jgi:hypothetical protein